MLKTDFFDIEYALPRLIAAIMGTVPTNSLFERRVDMETGDAFVFPAARREVEIDCLKQQPNKTSRFYRSYVIDGEVVEIERTRVHVEEFLYLINGNAVTYEYGGATKDRPVVHDLSHAYYVKKIDGKGSAKAYDPVTDEPIHLSKRDEEALFRVLSADGTADPREVIVKRIDYPESRYPETHRTLKASGEPDPC